MRRRLGHPHVHAWLAAGRGRARRWPRRSATARQTRPIGRREVAGILRLRPGLGTVPDEAAGLRAQLDRSPVGAIGASSLTTAELRLLPLLQTHLTFRGIGERLYVSPHTVKTQAISIYRKLGVTSRSAAISQACEVGLLTA